jgi:hypothetical protein
LSALPIFAFILIFQFSDEMGTDCLACIAVLCRLLIGLPAIVALGYFISFAHHGIIFFQQAIAGRGPNSGFLKSINASFNALDPD